MELADKIAVYLAGRLTDGLQNTIILINYKELSILMEQNGSCDIWGIYAISHYPELRIFGVRAYIQEEIESFEVYA